MDYDVSLQTISWFNGLRNDDRLEISPKFQRRAVWLEKERAALMDTVLKHLPFPEVYIQVVTDADTGRQTHVVVDGQQRITSILKFIDNEYPLPNDDDWSGEYFRDLSADVKESFWDYKVVVRTLRKTNDDEIRSIFSKLNTNNVALNDQELRNARYSGRFKQAAERLADNPYFQSIGLFTARDVRRMLDIEYVSELLVRQVFGITAKKDMLEPAYVNFDEDFPSESEYEDEFNATINLVRSIVDNSNKMVFKSKGNFHSLFGVCLEYFRKTGKNQFKKSEVVSEEITRLVLKAKADDFDPNEPDIEKYADVSTRSTSDKSRRAERERILAGIVSRVEGE
ncbi:DUF262 domain-containing protein [Pseudomaricurvus alkylphenolicus]|uniref:DUF262 domain-containing protein n=1 Tax=Pseudomaricurvus alkylphenolicus TaxID=1306991 RepID=UPI001423D41C|nr:DUF262 domain-containing protein [Pseudomaricurvus alkylphenolicus]NIB42110.1 DUF262 domain-containing protein [Pseudomaricurvus alkylphenolicus]